MRRAIFTTLLMLVGGCDSGMGSADGGGMDSGGGGNDAGMPGDDAGTGDPDGGPETCPPGQHACSDGCMELLPNNPSNGCALGCGEPCEVSDAICNPDGTCGKVGCEPMTCEDMGIECGVIDNGCGGRMTCPVVCSAASGERCVDGFCEMECSVDPHEPNDDSSVSDPGTDLPDNPNSSASITDGLLDSELDEDWYRFDVLDTGAGGNPAIVVSLSGVPSGSSYQLHAYFDCSDADESDNLSSCSGGASDGLIEVGCSVAASPSAALNFATECDWTTDESGTLWVRVRANSWLMCTPYTISVSVT